MIAPPAPHLLPPLLIALLIVVFAQFQSIPEYEYNFRADYVAKFNGPVKTKDSRRGMAHHCGTQNLDISIYAYVKAWRTAVVEMHRLLKQSIFEAVSVAMHFRFIRMSLYI